VSYLLQASRRCLASQGIEELHLVANPSSKLLQTKNVKIVLEEALWVKEPSLASEVIFDQYMGHREHILV
jgi:hypothetical protein